MEIIAEKKELIRLDNDLQQSSDPEMTCLITGEPCHPVELTAATMIPDSKSNAKIVSFQTSQGYDSYGKSKCYNAPISPEAEFKFSTALLHLLRPDSKNKFSISNRTFLFWSSCTSAETQDVLEQGLLSLFGSRDVSPDYGIEKIRRLFNSIYSGQLNISDNDRFYILGLSANAARIAVSYWDEMPLKDFAKNILQHFEDMEIVDTRLDKKPYSGLYSIVVSCISEEKVSDCKSKMPELITKSIFSGTPYPTNMFLGCINRLRASKPLTITRAAILKAYLNRRKDNQQKITTMLNPENTNPGYLSGRLFAVIDKAQRQANGIQSIRERYLNSASAKPAAIFPTILKLSHHHRDKLSKGSAIYYDKLIQEIMDQMGDSMPSMLSLEDQGRFFLGYYHQMQDFYKSNKSDDLEFTENK